MNTTKRRDEPEVLIRPGPYTLVNQAEAIIQSERTPKRNAGKCHYIMGTCGTCDNLVTHGPEAPTCYLTDVVVIDWNKETCQDYREWT